MRGRRFINSRQSKLSEPRIEFDKRFSRKTRPIRFRRTVTVIAQDFQELNPSLRQHIRAKHLCETWNIRRVLSLCFIGIKSIKNGQQCVLKLDRLKHCRRSRCGAALVIFHLAGQIAEVSPKLDQQI